MQKPRYRKVSVRSAHISIPVGVRKFTYESRKGLSRFYLCQVEVVDPNHKVVKFGTLQVGQTVRRSVPIINRSPAPISFHVAIMPTNPRLYKQNAIKVSPSQEVTLAPRGGSMVVDVSFSPKSRISHFTEEVN